MKVDTYLGIGSLKLSLGFLNKYKLAILAVFLFALYFSNNSYVISGDAIPTTLLPWAILEEHTIVLDNFTGFIITQWENHYFVVLKQGHLISFYPIVAAILALPFYLPAYIIITLSGRPVVDFTDSFIFTTGYSMKFAAVTMAVLSVVVLYLLLKRLFDDKWAYILAIVYGVCTSTWTISSQSLWQHGPAQLLIICCYFFILRNIDRPGNTNVLGIGAISALAFFNRPTDGILLIPAVFYVLKEKRWLAIPAFLIAGAPFMAYNQYYFGSVLGGYSNAVGTHIFSVMAAAPLAVQATAVLTNAAYVTAGIGDISYIGDIIKRYMDFFVLLLTFTPIALLAITGVINLLKQKKLTGIRLDIQMAILLSLLVYTLFFGLINFGSGWGYGPRYWSDAMPLIMIFIGWSKSESTLYKAAFASLALISFAIQAYGAYIYLLIPA
ncbi:hypothetical protein MCP_1701 [Methanocella paludicola SANAE]|uniref:Glycosyltransferase RgtA/B/C/D-like domain-containing protein n=1 Tax=Methanocella paludicola (strain DSM 17711 / JCM 13418 / NBRC 101707 / SANAE) TaxID=304371 RepID=D1YZA1_METPS|nr:glycosyltransferase family 39 protein [Methanocella paludicola]BAI61773.1 hypothetical protein MCP_1701 [Methanocella paludicola SANAE]